MARKPPPHRARIIKARITQPSVTVIATCGHPLDPFWIEVDRIARICGAVNPYIDAADLEPGMLAIGGGTTLAANVRDQEYEFPTVAAAQQFITELDKQIGIMPDADADRTLARLQRLLHGA